MTEQQIPLELLTSQAIEVREVGRVCSDEEIVLAIARARDALNAHEDPVLRSRHDALVALSSDRSTGRAKRRFLPFFSIYQGKQWAVDKLSGISL